MKHKTIGERLKILRDEYNLTSEKLATIVDLTRVTIDNIEKGVSNPYKRNVEIIAIKLGSTYEWLAEGKGEMLPNGKVEFALTKQTSEFDPATDTLYKELKRQINLVTIYLLNPNNLLKVLNKRRFRKI